MAMTIEGLAGGNSPSHSSNLLGLVMLAPLSFVTFHSSTSRVTPMKLKDGSGDLVNATNLRRLVGSLSFSILQLFEYIKYGIFVRDHYKRHRIRCLAISLGFVLTVIDARKEETSRWIDAAKFLTGASAIGSLAIPIILRHAHLIGTGAMLIEFTSFFIFVCTVLCFHRASLEDEW
ncbi:hypothetical protein RJ639_035948 [Escallonia herrerae]|uniref:Vacuolar protein sorting 55 n=1 Tax=Escallonia herrerae TaxID=1293975 RepID=A0AA88WW35_9ASTE|nr:hypothetical protein RJ639_035948 [Escallonia herrerae]